MNCHKSLNRVSDPYKSGHNYLPKYQITPHRTAKENKEEFNDIPAHRSLLEVRSKKKS